jgi:hypothetical protein
MKLYCIVILTAVLFLTSCSNDSSSAKDDTDNTIAVTTLPKGKLIIEEDYAAVTNPVNNTGTLNGPNSDKGSTPVNNSQQQQLDVKRRYKNLLVFHADDTMKIKKAYIATLVLAKDELYGDVKDEVLENSHSNTDNVKSDTTLDIGSTMKARLIDMSGATNKGFDIELISEEGSERNITDRRKKVMWQWKLIPQTEGQQELTLSITVVEKDGNKVTLPVRNIPVIIFAEKESWLTSAGNFFKDESTKWILTGLLIPIFIAWFGARMRHKFDSRSQREREAKEKAAASTANTAETPAPAQNTQGPA